MSNSETDSELQVSRYDPEDDINAHGSPVPPNTGQVDNVSTNAHAQDSQTQVSAPGLVMFDLIFVKKF